MHTHTILCEVRRIIGLPNGARISSTGLLKKKYTLSKFYFTKTTDAKSMSCVRMERKSLKVPILRLPATCCDECGKSWIIDLASATSHVGLTSSACKV
jgi:hypothetical protein